MNKSLVRNLKRVAISLLLHPPKYASRRHKFNCVYSPLDDSEKPIINSFFLHNQQCISGTDSVRPTYGNIGLACILYEFYSNGNSVTSNSSEYTTSSEYSKKCINIKQVCFEDDVKSTADISGYG